MDCDAAPPFPLDQYRRLQSAIPGVDGMYRVVRAALESRLGPGARILVAGGGGGEADEPTGRARVWPKSDAEGCGQIAIGVGHNSSLRSLTAIAALARSLQSGA